MKSTEQRDLYAEALDRYREEVPVEQWPLYSGTISKSGLERQLRQRGLSSFERKRLDSSKCRPILAAMNETVRKWQETRSLPEPGPEPVQAPPIDNAEVRKLQSRVKQLERDIENARRREVEYRKRCAVLEAEVEDMRRRRSAFEEHCHTSLTTLHV